MSEDQKIEILTVCRGNTKMMWAAKIVGILLHCDFRDAETELEKFFKARGQ